MIITGKDIGKKFGKNWIFRDLNFSISGESITGITGKNGAGKSTLLQIIAGFLTPSKGQVRYNDELPEEHQHSCVYIGPYTEIIEEYTLEEFLNFYSKFKVPNCSIKEMADKASLPMNKVIGDFSTGMKQRTQLLTAFYFENTAIFLDEPTSNLDQEGFDWWASEIKEMTDTIIVIASNDTRELGICSDLIDL